jgi:hypothetical protein
MATCRIVGAIMVVGSLLCGSALAGTSPQGFGSARGRGAAVVDFRSGA